MRTAAELASWAQGWDPAWSPDGAEIAFEGPGSVNLVIYTMKADGTNVALLMDNASEPAWMPAHVPVTTFQFACSGTTCNFDASGSKDRYGTITSYAWNLRDGTKGAGASLAHTYAGGVNYTVTLTVTDNNGATGTKIQTVNVNVPPVASFTLSCTCPPEKPQGRLILERPFSVVAGPRLRASPASNS